MTANSLSSSGLAGPVTFSEGDFQCGLWVDGIGLITISAFDRSDHSFIGTWSMAFVAGNPLSLPLDNMDAHESPSGQIDSQGYIWVAGNMWGSPTARIVRSEFPFNINSWIDVSSQIPDPTDVVHGYFNFVKFSDGALGLLMRQRYDRFTPNNNPAGERFMYLAPGSTTWEDRGYITKGDELTDDAFYRNNAYVDHDDVLHLAGAWDHAYGAGVIVDGSSYLRSTNRGITWTNVEGTVLTTPINRTGASGVAMRTNISYDSDTNNLYGMGGLTLDADGLPCFNYSKSGGNQRVVRYDGSDWWVDETAGFYYGGGQNLNLINWQGDLWALHRKDDFMEMRRHDGSVHEVIKLGGKCTLGWYCWPDPQVLLNEEAIEIFCYDTALYNSPKMWRFGRNARMVAV